MSKQHDLGGVLDAFCRCVDGVNGAVLATRDGLTVASTFPSDRSSRVAAMAATVQALAEQTVPPGEASSAGHTVVRGRDGCLVVHPAGDLAVLAVQTASRPNIGLVQVQAPEAAGELARLLG